MAIESLLATTLRPAPHPVANATTPPASTQSTPQAHGHASYMTFAPSHNDFVTPAPKRRKIEGIKHRQTTLDSFAVPLTRLPTPPSQITIVLSDDSSLPSLPADSPVDSHNLSAEEHLRDTAPSRARDSAEGHESNPPPTNGAVLSSRKEEKRTLRSQDHGPRIKSELAVYFPDYEDIMLGAPRPVDFLTVDSNIYVVQDTVKDRSKHAEVSNDARKESLESHKDHVSFMDCTITSQLPIRLNCPTTNEDSPSDVDMLARTLSDQSEDPLTDEYFLKAHRRAERKEKQLRNIEREKAMHEKVQLERILDGLVGHDWLRVLGITGITDGESRKYEAKRDYFIKEVRMLVDKFRQWKEQEKRQRLEKEEALAAAARAEESDDEDSEGDRESVETPSSDLNASAAQQLLQEAAHAAQGLPKIKLNLSRSRGLPPAPVPYVAPPPEVPITSFYERRHLRDAALGKSRHGRNVTAFGRPLPDVEEQEFVLPSEYVTELALRSNARERRRRKRETKAGS